MKGISGYKKPAGGKRAAGSVIGARRGRTYGTEIS